MARKVRVWIFALLALTIICFIFSNSLQGSEESHEASGWVADFLRPILNPNGWLDERMYHKLVRKLAHFTEFGALGVCLGGVVANVELRRRWLYSAALSVGVACVDEFIQSFTGRTNSITDVLIDTAGALCGLVFVWFIVYFYVRWNKEKL